MVLRGPAEPVFPGSIPGPCLYELREVKFIAEESTKNL